MKYILITAFALILTALGAAGFFMLRGGQEGTPKSKKMARALALRVALSALVFGLIWLSYWMGWLAPTGIPLHR
jgi:hypothetical protein